MVKVNINFEQQALRTCSQFSGSVKKSSVLVVDQLNPPIKKM